MSQVRPHGDRAEVAGWRQRASCREIDPELFFPDVAADASTPKRVCARCPVRKVCLDWALAHDEQYGVWGGLTNAERRRLRHRVSVRVVASTLDTLDDLARGA